MRAIGENAYLFTALAAAAAGVLFLAYPGPSLAAAAGGMAIWWDVLFPALFPFTLISEMLLGFGIVHFFGSLLDPLMRPLFRVPGIGGFVMAMGFASGYPIGARLTAQLWEQKLVTREEGERLVAFTTSSDPIFLLGAVAVGFFHDARLAGILAAAHYGAALLVGFAMRFHARGKQSPPPDAARKGEGTILLRSLRAMHEARLRDGRPFGLLLQQAVRSALQLVFVIGGLVVFFSVLMEALKRGGALEAAYAAVRAILDRAGLPASLSEALVGGLFEVTLGAKAAAGAGAGGGTAAGTVYAVAAAAFVLSWAGLSVHAQIVSLLHRTNLRYAPFVAARLAHAVLAAAAVLLLWDPLQPLAAGVGAAPSPGAILAPGGSAEAAAHVPGAGGAALTAAAAFFSRTQAVWRDTVPFSFAVFVGVLGSLLLVAAMRRLPVKGRPNDR